MIYLDNAATTRVYPEAVAAMQRIYSEDFYNPSSTYAGGIKVKQIINESRLEIARALNCSSGEIYFTSCATESNNWAMNSGFKNKKGNIVISAGEHAGIYECAKNLKNKGYEVRIAALNGNGETDKEALLKKVDENTAFVSVIHASNETGTLNDIAALSSAVKSVNNRIIFHSDGVQAFLKTSCDVKSLGVDMYSVSGHKVGAPKGIGALYVSSKINIQPFIFGGGQENAMRSGTENAAGILAFAEAVRRFGKDFSETEALRKRKLLINELKKSEGIQIIGGDRTTGMITAFSAIGTKAEIIQSMCADNDVIIGRGSACSSRHGGNRVLAEMGLNKAQIDGTLRISFSPATSDEEIIEAVRIIACNIEKLRGKRIG